MSKFEQLLMRYKASRDHSESCVKKLQHVLDCLRADWGWPEQQVKSTKHIYHNLRYESRKPLTPGRAEIFGHGAFSADLAGDVYATLSATVAEEHMQAPLSVHLSIVRVEPGKWRIGVNGKNLAVHDDNDGHMRELSEHIFEEFMSELSNRHWAPSEQVAALIGERAPQAG